MRVSAKDLRTQTKRLLESVDRGEEVIITYRGKARARIVPIESKRSAISEQELFGIWRDYSEVQDVERFVDELRRGRD